MDIKVIVAAHKPCEIPADDVYLPVFVGAKGKAGLIGKRKGANESFARDDTGDNISDRNPAFCELTGLYWAWKNLDAEAIGLVHYRRLFGTGNHHEPMRAYTRADYEKAFEQADLLVPFKRHYFITTLYKHYSDTHSEDHLKAARAQLLKLHPEYEKAFDTALSQSWGYMFNMLVAKRAVLDEYCSWLFPILFAMEGEIETEGMSSYNQRLFGRISELLFNVWILFRTDENSANKLRISEIPWYSTEKVQWAKKITAFTGAMFGGKKYEGSF